MKFCAKSQGSLLLGVAKISELLNESDHININPQACFQFNYLVVRDHLTRE